MERNYLGYLITFEGGEKAGKGTQISLLEKYFQKHNINYALGRDPGGFITSEAIRKVLLDGQLPKIPVTELFLHEAARAEYVHNIMMPALLSGKIFVSDRFYDSTTVYQGYAGGLDISLIQTLNLLASNNIVPDLTILMDLSPEIGLARSKSSKQEFKSGDWHENKPLSFHEKVREGYANLHDLNPGRFRLVDSLKNLDECHLEIIRYVNDILIKAGYNIKD